MSKDKMIEWLEVLHKQIEVPELTKNGRIMAVDILFHEVETALEEVSEHGHWIELDKCSNSGYYCSECHKKVVKEGWSDTVKIIKYCPNCGAKMCGGDNE